MSLSLLKSILHNIGVVIVGLGFAYLGTRVDLLLGIRRFYNFLTTTAGWLLMSIGFLLRVWATFHFYQHRIKVISLVPPTGTYYLRSVSFLKKSAVSWRKCFCFFRSSATSWIASCPCSNHTPSSLSESCDQARGEAVSTGLWLGVESLQKPST
jgi:hypothetical protein